MFIHTCRCAMVLANVVADASASQALAVAFVVAFVPADGRAFGIQDAYSSERSAPMFVALLCFGFHHHCLF